MKNRLMRNHKGQLQNLATMLVGVIVFAAMIPILLSVVATTNAPGITGTLLSYLPLFVVLGIALAIIAWAIKPMVKKFGTQQLDAFYRDRRGQLQIGALVSAIMIVTVGVIFFPIIQDSIDDVTVLAGAEDPGGENWNENQLLTGPALTMAQLIPMFYVLALVFIGIGFAMKGMGKIE